MDVKQATVRTWCRSCGRSLGRYWLFRGTLSLLAAVNSDIGRGTTAAFPGFRTGTGVRFENHEGRLYARVVCKCGRNEKIRESKLPEIDAPDVYV